jgi:hypothetical protein
MLGREEFPRGSLERLPVLAYLKDRAGRGGSRNFYKSLR